MIRDWLRSSMGVFGCFGIVLGFFAWPFGSCGKSWSRWVPVKPGVSGNNWAREGRHGRGIQRSSTA